MKNTVKKHITIVVMAAFMSFGFMSMHEDSVVSFVQECHAAAKAAWQQEFDEVCSKTMEAMDLPTAELRQLIERCDKIQPVIDKLDETQKKVYQRRLKMCRDMYVFALESKETKK